ncbi:MAG: Kazal-type serine protease inhibitor [Candidatus Pacebacteria bacterium]|nr:Kazal-type serine protease inhibitor [Candidatus Paceibacterota bacterium]
MKKIILILFCLICILSFSDVYALQGKILSINKEKNIALIKEEPKLNFFERILSFFNLKKQEPIIYEVSLNSEKINTVDSFLFFQQKKEQPIQDVSVGDVIEITNVFENIIKKENSPTYDTTDLNYNYDSIFSGFANTPTTIFKESDKVGIMVTTKPSIDSKVECLSNKDCMFCNGACISLLKTKNIIYCNNVPPSNLSCVCKDGFCLKNISNDYIISQETKHCTFRENPVCGVDNTTYLNECFAKAANVEIACNKACPCTESTTTTIYTTTTTVSTTTIPSTTTTVPLPTTTIPNQESIKVTCEMFGGV